MKAYRVSGIGFGVCAGALFLISAAQAVDRGHKIDLVEKPKEGEAFVLVRACDVQQFKVGELLGLMDLPKGQAQMVESVEAKMDGEPETDLVKACRDFHASAEEAEKSEKLRRQTVAEEAKKANSKPEAHNLKKRHG